MPNIDVAALWRAGWAKLGRCGLCMGLSLAGTLLFWALYAVLWSVTTLPLGQWASALFAVAFTSVFIAHITAFTLRTVQGTVIGCAGCGTRMPSGPAPAGLTRRQLFATAARAVATGIAVSAMGLVRVWAQLESDKDCEERKFRSETFTVCATDAEEAKRFVVQFEVEDFAARACRNRKCGQIEGRPRLARECVLATYEMQFGEVVPVGECPNRRPRHRRWSVTVFVAVTCRCLLTRGEPVLCLTAPNFAAFEVVGRGGTPDEACTNLGKEIKAAGDRICAARPCDEGRSREHCVSRPDGVTHTDPISEVHPVSGWICRATVTEIRCRCVKS